MSLNTCGVFSKSTPYLNGLKPTSLWLTGYSKGNVEIYAILLRIHQSLPRPPTSQLDDNILFIDVLNRQHSLPYAYFQHWEVGLGICPKAVLCF